MWELRSYFGLTFAQLTEMQENWNKLYNEERDYILEFQVPSAAPYDDA